jgi:hypothetical protein
VNNQTYTVAATAHGKAHKSSGLTHKQAAGLVADLQEWGADDAAMTPEPNLVWTALTTEQRRERAQFWQAAVCAVCVGALAAALFWASLVGACHALAERRAEASEVAK